MESAGIPANAKFYRKKKKTTVTNQSRRMKKHIENIITVKEDLSMQRWENSNMSKNL